MREECGHSKKRSDQSKTETQRGNSGFCGPRHGFSHTEATLQTLTGPEDPTLTALTFTALPPHPALWPFGFAICSSCGFFPGWAPLKLQFLSADFPHPGVSITTSASSLQLPISSQGLFMGTTTLPHISGAPRPSLEILVEAAMISNS